MQKTGGTLKTGSGLGTRLPKATDQTSGFIQNVNVHLLRSCYVYDLLLHVTCTMLCCDIHKRLVLDLSSVLPSLVVMSNMGVVICTVNCGHLSIEHSNHRSHSSNLEKCTHQIMADYILSNSSLVVRVSATSSLAPGSPPCANFSIREKKWGEPGTF